MMKKIGRLLTFVLAVLTFSVMAVAVGCNYFGDASSAGSSNTGSFVEDSSKEDSSVEENSGQNSSDEAPTTRYTVIFVVDGGTAPVAQTVNEGEKATRPEDPVKVATSHTTEYTFVGWFTKDGETETEWNFFENEVTEDVTLYAKFIEEQVATPNYGKN